MFPVLLNEDIVYLKKIRYPQLKVNDIITVKKFHKLFTHRIIFKTAKHLITKGDNNLTSDGKIYPRQIIGRVYQMKRKGKVINPENLYLVQSSLYFTEIVKIKKALEKEKIDFVFLKGLPLHLYYEGSHPRRIYADCDVLIVEKDYLKAKKILEKAGYKYHDDSYSKFHKILKNKQTEFSFYKNINKFPVLFDVHLEPVFMMNQLGELTELYPQVLVNRLTIEFLNSKQSITIQNEKFLLLNSYFLILYLALHFFHHNFRGSHRLELLDKVIRKAVLLTSPQGNPYIPATPGVFLSLSEIITKYKLQNFVYPAFVLLKKLYKTPMPQDFLKSIQPSNFQLQYLSSIINHPSLVFDDEPRVKAGITRFKNLFFLSPNPWWGRLMIIFNTQVIYSVIWVIWRKFKRK